MAFTEATIPQAVVAAIREAVAPFPGRLVIGYSGGLDSTVLLHGAVRAGLADRIVAAHVNHNAQPAARGWVEHCRRQAALLGVGWRDRTLILPLTGNFEQAARDGRYRWFAEVLGSGDCLLLAHHQDDQAETLLLRAVTGRGAYGMPARRAIGNAILVRPLLAFSRAELSLCARAWSLDWVEDPTNAVPSRDRSFLRLQVMPLLTSRWSEACGALASVATSTLAAREAGQHLAAALPEPLPLSSLPVAAPAAIEVLLWWLAARGAADVPRASLRRLLPALRDEPGRQQVCNLPGGRLIAYRQGLYFQPAIVLPALPATLTVPGTIELDHGVLTAEPLVAEAASVTYTVVFRAGGERIRLGGRERAVSRLLASRVLPWERARYPLVVRNGDVVAVPGIAAADDLAVNFRWRPRIPVFLPGVG
ncbi:MAG: tRNA lysidine(34) synthetase TilS [Pseudomonadales bacterium]|nr:tRNA lysidine(34) synthetase TilS [Pseudomonadales bacterium]MCP5182842.1 tRNA lysidine(34) synthetase TilS [Pseudomonadales bacterium]